MTSENILNKVKKIVTRANTTNPFQLCDFFDINLYYKDLGANLKGYYFCQSRIKNIVINNRLCDDMKKVLCAHELGHALLHKTSSCALYDINFFKRPTKLEYEANLFAAELLIKDEDLLNIMFENSKSSFEIAKELCVPPELLSFKFKAIKTKNSDLTIPCEYISDFLKQKCDTYYQ